MDNRIIKLLLKIAISVSLPNQIVQGTLNELIDYAADTFETDNRNVCEQLERIISDELSINKLKQLGIPSSKINYIQSECTDLLSKITVTPELLSRNNNDMRVLANELVKAYQSNTRFLLEDVGYITAALSSLLPKVINCLLQSQSFLLDWLLRLEHMLTDKQQILCYEKNPYPIFISDRPLDIAECFIGRDEIIKEIVEDLSNGISITLSGVGGMGKTEIAKSVIHILENQKRDLHHIEKIAWVQYGNQNVFHSIARALYDTSAVEDVEIAWQRAYSIILAEREKLLIVIDNIESDVDKNLLRIANLPCRFLLTSRIDKISSIKSKNVDSLSLSNCIELFKYYYKKPYAPPEYIGKIIRLADQHTVAIELLAKIANIDDCTLEEFYHRLVEKGFCLSDEQTSVRHEKLQNEERIIVQLSILFSMNRLQDEILDLLVPISVIPALPFSFVQAELWFKQDNKTNLNYLVKSGWLYSTRNGGITYYVIHSVIASAIRFQYINDLYSRCRNFIASLTEDLKYSEDEHGSEKVDLIQFSWSINDLLYDHLNEESDGDFLFFLSRIYKDIGNYKEAKRLLQKCIIIYKEHPDTANNKLPQSYCLLGLVYNEMNYHKEAIDQYHEALRLLKKSNHQNKDKISLYVNIGLAYAGLEGACENGNATSYLKDALCLAEETYGEKDPRTLDIRFQLATCMSLSNAAQATTIFEDVINYEEIIYGPNHLKLAEKYRGYGDYLFFIGEYAQAAEKLEKALDIYRNKLDKRHPDIADVNNTLGLIFRYVDNGKAQKAFQEYLDISLSVFGEISPITAGAYNNLGLCKFNDDDFEQALIDFQKAESIVRKLDYYNPEDMGSYLGNQAQCYGYLCDYDRAIEYHKKADLEYQKSPEICVEQIGRNYGQLADVYFHANRNEKAYEYFGKAINHIVKNLGSEHLALASIYNNYALLLEKDHDETVALEKLKAALHILETTYAGETIYTKDVLDNIERIQHYINKEKR